ncbi:hypothetical protein ACJX0J_029950, partial [Zea mays]
MALLQRYNIAPYKNQQTNSKHVTWSLEKKDSSKHQTSILSKKDQQTNSKHVTWSLEKKDSSKHVTWSLEKRDSSKQRENNLNNMFLHPNKKKMPHHSFSPLSSNFYIIYHLSFMFFTSYTRFLKHLLNLLFDIIIYSIFNFVRIISLLSFYWNLMHEVKMGLAVIIKIDGNHNLL